MRKLKELFLKYQEVLLYLIVGGCTTVVSFASYAAFAHLLQLNYMVANALSWVCSVSFAFFANRILVFKSQKKGFFAVAGELCLFVGCRLFSGAMDMAIMFLSVDVLHIDDMVAKILTQVVTLVLNYLFSKLLIFRKNPAAKGPACEAEQPDRPQPVPGMLSVVLPAYNEGTRIFENALKTCDILEKFSPLYEVLVVDDGSKDNTLSETLRACRENNHITALSAEKNGGKGWALCLGTAYAKGEYIAFCDADFDLNPAQLEGYLKIMQQNNADVVIASKMHPQSAVDYPFVRRVYSWGYYTLLMLLFHLNIRDTQTGLKLFRSRAIKPVMRQLRVKKFAFDIEMLVLLNSRGYTIESAPVRVSYQRSGEERNGRIKIKDIFVMLKDTFAVFGRLHFTRIYQNKQDNPEIAEMIQHAKVFEGVGLVE